MKSFINTYKYSLTMHTKDASTQVTPNLEEKVWFTLSEMSRKLRLTRYLTLTLLKENSIQPNFKINRTSLYSAQSLAKATDILRQKDAENSKTSSEPELEPVSEIKNGVEPVDVTKTI